MFQYHSREHLQGETGPEESYNETSLPKLYKEGSEIAVLPF